MTRLTTRPEFGTTHTVCRVPTSPGTRYRTPSPLVDRRCSVDSVHFVIMGCGRVGASLARAIERAGHEVAVIDQDQSSFRRLGTTFEGRTVTGVGFDRDTLRAAGIENYRKRWSATAPASSSPS